MTISTVTNRNDYVGTGIVGPYAYNFRITNATDLVVTRTVAGATTTLAYPVDYVVSGVGNRSGGAITLTAALVAGGTLAIERVVPLTQTTSLANQSTYNPETIEAALDKSVMIDQQQQERIDRAITLDDALDASLYDLTLPAPTAGRVLTGTGTGFTMSTLDSSATALPGAGRTETTLSGYLLTNAVYNVLNYGATRNGITDDTSAIQAALNAANSAGGGIVTAPVGTYLCGDLTIYSNTTILCAGWGTHFKKKPTATYLLSVNPGTGGTTSTANNQQNIQILNGWFEGLSASGFVEHQHLLNFNAVSDLLVEGCKLTSFEGDGIYIGSSNVGGTERHNERVTIRRNYFDGVNKQNRNGVSIIDCDTAVVENNYFTRCATTSQPGAIDIEPDGFGFPRVRAIRIRNNRFSDIGGNVAAIAVALPVANGSFATPSAWVTLTAYTVGQYVTDGGLRYVCILNHTSGATTEPGVGASAATYWGLVLTAPIHDIRIENNHIDGTAVAGITVLQATAAQEYAVPIDVKITGNTVANAARAFTLDGARGIELRGNTWRDCTGEPLIGMTYRCMDIAIVSDTFARFCSVSGGGLTVYTVTRLTVDGNDFSDSGPNGGAYAMSFQTGTSSYVTLTRNKFRAPLGKMGYSIVSGPHTFTPATNTTRDNTFTDGVAAPGVNYLPYPDGDVSADRGNADVTLVAGTDIEVQRFNTALTANRAVTLPASMGFLGRGFTIVRNEAAPTAFTLAVKNSAGTTLATIPASKNGHITVRWDGTAFQVASVGAV